MAEQEYTPTEAETTSPHRIDITLDDRGNVAAKLSCSAPVGAPCRLWCDEGCEYADEEHRKGHVLTDQGSCARTVGWFDDAPLELYDGPEVPLRSGPVVLSWDGDTYLWSYAPDEGAKRPDREQIARTIYLADALRDEEDARDWDEGRVDLAQRNAYLSMADAVLASLALEPEAREDRAAALATLVVQVRTGRADATPGLVDLHIANAVLERFALAEAREVTDAEQFMLRISATWDEDGKQHMPDLVGPFVSEHAAMLWMQAQAPFFGSYATSPWPASPEGVFRG